MGLFGNSGGTISSSKYARLVANAVNGGGGLYSIKKCTVVCDSCGSSSSNSDWNFIPVSMSNLEVRCPKCGYSVYKKDY